MTLFTKCVRNNQHPDTLGNAYYANEVHVCG